MSCEVLNIAKKVRVKDFAVACLCSWKGYASQTPKVNEFGVMMVKCPECGRDVGNINTHAGRAKFRWITKERIMGK